MAQPPSYVRQKNFADDFGNETDHPSLNAELDRASNSINDIRTNLAILQADDGKLRPSVVTADSISEELRISLVEGVVMDAQTMLDRSLAAAEASSASAREAKAYEALARESSVVAAESAKALSLAVRPDWNLSGGPGEILNKPDTLAGYGITDGLSKSALKARDVSSDYDVGDIVVAPYILDTILVCTVAGRTSAEELDKNGIVPGSDIGDGSVVWNVRKKFSGGLKTDEGTVSVDAHHSPALEYGGGNPQYYGHVKVIDDAYSRHKAESSVALSPFGAREMINNVVLGKNAGFVTQSCEWVCPASGTYTITLVGGGGGGGGGGGLAYYTRFNVSQHTSKTFYGGGGGGGGGGAGDMASISVDLAKDDKLIISVGAGGNGGAAGSATNNGGGTASAGTSGSAGGQTSVTLSGSGMTYNAAGGNGGIGGNGGTAWDGGGNGGIGGSFGNSMNTQAIAGTDGSPGMGNSSSGGAGGNGGHMDLTSPYFRFGSGGGGGGGKENGADGEASSLATGGSGGNGGMGGQGMVYIALDSI